ncbi:MAG: agmatine deiminase family protein [Thermomicrobiales bacterium]|nr:agmatine deiminase family protein [Thermomicrobiales bacterium]
MTSLHEPEATRTAAPPGLRMPAEWEPHERCLVAWPTRDALWRQHAEEAKREYAALIAAIARFEPVLAIAAPGREAEVRAYCGSAVETIELPIDDSWIRDSGPIFVVGPDGRRAAVDFRFNAWGERFHPYADDDRLPERLLAALGVARIASPMVLEGGSITVDGEGTLITTEQCLLNPNRNPEWSREQIEAELRRCLGVQTIIWLPYGAGEDSMTDGHVDGVCSFVRPGVVLLQAEADPASPYHARHQVNRQRLEAARDARGRRLEIIDIPQMAFAEVDGAPIRVPLANVYLANGGVVAPVPPEQPAAAWLAVLAEVFPEREIVPVPMRVLPWNGGAIHCVTQQVPAAGGGHG